MDPHETAKDPPGRDSDGDKEVRVRQVANATHPPKKTRTVTSGKGAAKYKTQFQMKWKRQFPFINKVTKDQFSFHCSICDRTIKCSHMGIGDVQRHVGKEMHQKNARALNVQTKLQFVPKSDPIIDKVIRAETKVAMLLVKNNIPLALSDELTPLFHDIFPDSQIAKNYSSRRTKTACIINGAIAPFYQCGLIEYMVSHPFSLAIDGSSDNEVEKMNPLTVRIYDINKGKVMTQFLDMCMSASSTAEALFTKMDEVLTKHNIPWTNCIGLGVDNTSVNMGCRNSIKTRVLQKNSAIYIMGCGCHIVHNTAMKASEAFERVSHFSVEDIAIDIFYWFDKSTKRKAKLVEMCSFCDIKYRQVLKHVSTRWLSLDTAVSRILQQYDGLKSYFLSEDDRQQRFTRLRSLFDDPMTQVYLLFYQSALQTFMQFNLFLQREDPIIPIVYDQMKSFMNRLACRFVAVTQIKYVEGDLSDLKFKDVDVQLPDSSLFIGFATKQLLRKLMDDGSISARQEATFYQSVRAFYTRAFEYALNNLPLHDDLLKNAAFLNFNRRDNATFNEVEYFIERFNPILPFRPEEMDKLAEEFPLYQMLTNDDIPPTVWEKANISDNGSTYHRLDVLWHHISTRKAADGTLQYPYLCKVAKLVMVIPHSNAQEERVFSMVRKNKTSFRPNLDPKGTLSSILTIKLAQEDKAHEVELPEQVWKKAKKATWAYNKAHSANS